jgi:hypothetical protein
MATVVYKQYYDAYDLDKTIIDNVDFEVNLVSEDYNPKKGHKRNDVRDYIICNLKALDGDIIRKKTMSEIIDKIKDKAEKWIPKNIEAVRRDVEKVFANKPNKVEKLVELIGNTDFETDKRDYWENLKKHGIKWFVIESKDLNIICFAEEIE